ncbi:hypothetical protein [Salinigranum halophilum]|uniref:hypothetical protein n=1 Tax=Salinigranum halophilum TaxID=2565931 RepID=UPI0010A8174C|nr:hypothetical protein [Salinigranum halophilum]
MDTKSIIKNLSSNWKDTDWWRHVAYPFAVRQAILQPYYRLNPVQDGVHVMERDWDNLIILDGCRYDMFEQIYSGPGELRSVKSLGSATPEFLGKNFAHNQHYDTVYVTANPQVNVHTDDVFHNVINVWETSWDEDLNTVHPKEMADATIKAYREYPNKRIISHFVQPHYPFIGEFGRTQLGNQAGVELSKRMADDEAAESDEDHAWLQLRKNNISLESLKQAYYENLEITLPYVRKLLFQFEERTVVTSDHGNMYGQPGPFGIPIFGHPNGVHHDDLVKVPWLVVDGVNKRITDEIPSRSEISKDVSEQLNDLGYR